MKIFQAKNDENVADELIELMEQQTQKEVFTLRIVGEQSDAIEVVVAFKDKSMLMGKITVTSIEGKLAARIQGNFI